MLCYVGLGSGGWVWMGLGKVRLMEAECLSKTLVSTYKFTRRYTQKTNFDNQFTFTSSPRIIFSLIHI
jgi:hypothetical protein